MAISLSPASRGELRNALRLLKLLFRYGDNKEVASQFQQGYTTGSVDTWLQVRAPLFPLFRKSTGGCSNLKGNSPNYRAHGFSEENGASPYIRPLSGGW